MACNSIFYKFSLSRFLSIWILSYKCSYLFYNIPNNNFYRPLCVYMDDFGEAIKAIRERRRRWEETANVICRKVSAENCHSRSPPLPPKAFLSSTSWGSSRIIEEERLWQSASLSSHRLKSEGREAGWVQAFKEAFVIFSLLFFLSHQSGTPLTHFSDWECLQFDILIANWFLIRPEYVRCLWMLIDFGFGQVVWESERAERKTLKSLSVHFRTSAYFGMLHTETIKRGETTEREANENSIKCQR